MNELRLYFTFEPGKILGNRMGVRLTVDQPAAHQIQLLLRQDSGEVAQFLLFVFVIAGALFLLTPQVRSSPAPLLGLVGAAVAWCAVARSARECYLFDRAARTVRLERVSLLGRSDELLSIQEVAAVQQALRGPDDDRLVLELVTGRGEVQLRLPRRFTTLGLADQSRVGRLVADHLGLALRLAPDSSAAAGG